MFNESEYLFELALEYKVQAEIQSHNDLKEPVPYWVTKEALYRSANINALERQAIKEGYTIFKIADLRFQLTKGELK